MTDDPLDLTQVAADDLAVEQLRIRAIRPDDNALQLLRDLLADVDGDQPLELPVGSGSTVLRLAGETTADTRVARSGTVAALIAAGMVVFGGVAAASTAVAPGNPLHGLGESVRSAASAVVEAVKPPETTRRAESDAWSLPAPASSRATEALTSRPSVPVVPGPEAAAVRSDTAARQVAALLDEAEQLLAQRRAAAAGARLDVAERRLADVLGEAADALRTRLEDLRAQVEVAGAPGPAAPAAPAPEAEPRTEPEPDARPESKQPSRTAPKDEPRAESAPPPDRSQQSGALVQAPAANETAAADSRTVAPGQPSRLASAKPRA